MGRFEITSPTGEKFEINAPDGASEDEVMSYAQKQFASQAAPAPASPVQPQQRQPLPAAMQFERGPDKFLKQDLMTADDFKGDPIFTDPGARKIIQDRLLLGFGGELEAGIEGLTGDKPLQEGYDQSLRETEAAKAATPPGLATRAHLTGGLGSGGLIAQVANPKNVPKMIGLGTTSAGAEEYGAADPFTPGAREEAGKMGAMFGMGGSTALPMMESLMRGVPSVATGVKRMFSDQGPKPGILDVGKRNSLFGSMTPEQLAREEAEMLIARAAKGEGKSLEKSAQRAEQLGPDATVVDALGDEFSGVLGNLTRGSSAARRTVEGSGILDRIPGKNALKESVDEIIPSALPQAKLDIVKQVQAKGGQIDELVSGEMGKTALPNQDKLMSFLERDLNRPLLKAARKAKEARTGERGKGVASSNLVDAQGRPIQSMADDDIIDVELADYIKAEFNKKISEINRGGTNTTANAQAIDLKRQWDELTEPHMPDELTSLRGEYGALKKQQRAIEDRFEKTAASVAPQYRKGAAEGIDDIATGKLSVAEWWDRFRGKRAYSKVGAAGLVGNEVMDVLMTPGIPRSVKAELTKILVSSDDVPGFLRRASETSISREAMDELAVKTIKAARKQRGVQYGQASGVLGAMTQDRGQ